MCVVFPPGEIFQDAKLFVGVFVGNRTRFS